MRLFLLLLLVCSYPSLFAQKLTGRVMQNNNPIANALIVNLTNDQQSHSDRNGEFSITAQTSDKIRIIKSSYDLLEFRVSQLQTHKDYELIPLAIEIDEVKIVYRPTGDLEKDSQHYGASLQERRINTGLRRYFKKPSDLSVLKPKQGEFIQPVGPGFAVGSINNRWTMTDWVIWLHDELTDDYFKDLGLISRDIDRFLYYSLPLFNATEIRTILKYGFCSNFNIGQLKLLFESTILNFTKSGIVKN